MAVGVSAESNINKGSQSPTTAPSVFPGGNAVAIPVGLATTTNSDEPDALARCAQDSIQPSDRAAVLNPPTDADSAHLPRKSCAPMADQPPPPAYPRKYIAIRNSQSRRSHDAGTAATPLPSGVSLADVTHAPEHTVSTTMTYLRRHGLPFPSSANSHDADVA